MNRTARDRSERVFLFSIAILIVGLIWFVVYDLPEWTIFGGLYLILALLSFRSFCISKRSKQDTAVIRQITRGKNET